jgi:putative transposase
MLDLEMGANFGHKGWHSRGYLPHLDAPNEIQALTFRLADALPAKVVAGWRKELVREEVDSGKREQRLRRQIARYEDAGHGAAC